MTRIPSSATSRFIGAAAILLSLVTWTMDWTHIVEACPYCETQRTIIGMLGVLLLLPVRRSWWIRYAATVLAAYGVVVGSNQHFKGWLALFKGQHLPMFPLYSNSFLLSAAAIMIMIGEWCLLFDLHDQSAIQVRRE